MVNVYFSRDNLEAASRIEWNKENKHLVIELFLNYGFLCETLDSDSRRQLIHDTLNGVYDNLYQDSLNNLDYLLKLSESEDICIWFSDSDPNELISYYFLCHKLLCRDNKIFIQAFPSSIYKPLKCWAEMDLEQISLMKDNIRLIEKSELITTDNKWINLLQEKSALRIVKDGEILHVDESYYDELIIKAKKMTSDEDLIPGYVFGMTNDSIDAEWIISRYRKIK